MRAVALAVSVGLVGCSLVYVSGPPPGHKDQRMFDCTASHFVPAVDVAVAVLGLLNLGVATRDNDQQWNDLFGGNPPIARTTAIPLYAAATVIAVGSAVTGFLRVDDCRTAKDAMAERWKPPPDAAVPPPDAAMQEAEPDAADRQDAAPPDSPPER